MSAEAPAVVRAWSVGAFTVTMSIPRPKPGGIIHALVEWAPREPSMLSADEWKEYRLGRNAALAEMADELGINVAVLDL